MDDHNWNRIKSGDKRAFPMLYDEYYSSLCLYANSLIGDLDMSQDIVSDCFVRIWERKETRYSLEEMVVFCLCASSNPNGTNQGVINNINP